MVYAGEGAGNVFVTPEKTNDPFTKSGKSEIFFVPPPSFTTTFTTLIVAAAREVATAATAGADTHVGPVMELLAPFIAIVVPPSEINRPLMVELPAEVISFCAMSVPTNALLELMVASPATDQKTLHACALPANTTLPVNVKSVLILNTH